MRHLWLVLQFLVLSVTSVEAKSLALYSGEGAPVVVCDQNETTPLGKAAHLLAGDLTKLMGRAPEIASAPPKTAGVAIMVGLASSPSVSALLKANGISTTPIDGKWETYGRATVPNPGNRQGTILVIFGSDIRGTIWGVIDLTREMGVSPWEWWADVGTRKVSKLSVDGALRYSKEPSVKYRGIFLNDEDWGLLPWASKTYDPAEGNIGPKTYARVFELMWRLKANIIWPAMHPVTNPFDSVAGNAEMAASYAIIHGSSHAEPILRANEREWDEKSRGPFNYLTNRENLLRYWDEALADKGRFENFYSVGLRGTGDGPMEGAATPQEAAAVLSNVIADQRQLLQKRIGKPADQIPQTLTPYKEVLLAYDAGVKLPDDITITWPDDNHGYIRRLSNASERARSGGSGVYYHLSYWGAPMSYLWLATTHPSLVWEEMDKAFRYGARRLWIANVGDIKPAEYLTQFFLDMAFDKEAFPDIQSARTHLRNWMADAFGQELAPEITDIMWRYYALAYDRRPEFMGWNEIYPNRPMQPTKFNVLDFGDENARRMQAYQDLARRVDAVAQHIASDRRDAFFELVQYPVEAAAAFNERVLSTDKALAYGMQHRASVDQYADQAKAAELRIDALTDRYNNSLAQGKWRYMMDAAPQKLDQFGPQPLPKWTPSADSQCGVQAEGDSVFVAGVEAARLPVFQRGLERTRYLDIFARAPEVRGWTAATKSPWIKLSQTGGRLTPAAAEARIRVSIDWSIAPKSGKGRIELACEGQKPMRVDVQVATAEREETSFVEENRIVSIYAVHATTRSEGWEALDSLGHTGASLRSKLDTKSLAGDDLTGRARAPRLVYRFSTVTEDDPATLKVIALPMAPITSENGMRIAVSIDRKPAEVIDLSSAEFSETWRQNVLSNTATATVGNLHLAKGAHELSITALDPGVTLDRIEISFAGASAAYDAVPETRLSNGSL